MSDYVFDGACFTFTTKSSTLPEIQNIVKKYNMRFMNNPSLWLYMPNVVVSISYDGLSKEEWIEARAAIDAVINPAVITQKKVSIWTKLFNWWWKN